MAERSIFANVQSSQEVVLPFSWMLLVLLKGQDTFYVAYDKNDKAF